MKKRITSKLSRISSSSAMIWSFVIAVNLFELISTGPHISSEISREAKRASFSKTDSPAVEKDIALSFSGDENRKERIGNHLISALDQSHVTRLVESNKRGPYFWENESFKSNVHVGWQSIDKMRRKRSQASTIKQVQIIQVECAVLRRNLESHQELKLLIDLNNNQNAYQALNSLLERMSYILIYLFYPEKYGDNKNLKKIEIPYEALWNPLLSDVKTTIGKLEYLLLNFQPQHQSSIGGQNHGLINQVLSILNFLMKNNLINEKMLEELFSKENIKNLISNYIIEMFSLESFLQPVFHECILKSKFTEHLVYALRFFQQDFFRNVEYEILKTKIKLLNGPINELPHEISQKAKEFTKYSFGKDDGINVDKKEYIIKCIVAYFESEYFSHRYFRKDATFGIMYGMIWFFMKYYPEVLKRSLEDDESIHSFSLKMKTLDSAMGWLRNARELQFLASNGFYSSELSPSKSSEFLIELTKAKYWIPSPNEELENFKKDFRCYTSKDFDNWEGFFKEKSSERGKFHSNVSECFPQKYTSQGRSSNFGTNVKLVGINKESWNADQNSFESEPMISGVFLLDLYSWINRLELVVENHQENLKVWSDIAQMINSGSKSNINEDFSEWFQSSWFLSFVIEEMNSNLFSANYDWQEIKGKMEILNRNIELLSYYSPNEHTNLFSEDKNKMDKDENKTEDSFQNDYEDSATSRQDYHIKEGLIIPNLEFLRISQFS